MRAARPVVGSVALRCIDKGWKAGYRHGLGERTGTTRFRTSDCLSPAARAAAAERGGGGSARITWRYPWTAPHGWGDDVYQPDQSEVQDDAGLLGAEDTLESDGVNDPLDRGWSPPERPWAVERKDVTAAERLRGETLDERLAVELPEVVAPDGDGIGDSLDSDGEALDNEVGTIRSGRLVAPDEGAHGDEESELIATDVGIDGAAASAEEAAMHIVDEDAQSG